jgi:hypothetical protein
MAFKSHEILLLSADAESLSYVFGSYPHIDQSNVLSQLVFVDLRRQLLWVEGRAEGGLTHRLDTAANSDIYLVYSNCISNFHDSLKS